jgi:hypothetical protein
MFSEMVAHSCKFDRADAKTLPIVAEYLMLLHASMSSSYSFESVLKSRASPGAHLSRVMQRWYDRFARDFG